MLKGVTARARSHMACSRIRGGALVAVAPGALPRRVQSLQTECKSALTGCCARGEDQLVEDWVLCKQAPRTIAVARGAWESGLLYSTLYPARDCRRAGGVG